jgi:hypothetical protein
MMSTVFVRRLGKVGVILTTLALVLGIVSVASAAITAGNQIAAPASVIDDPPGATNSVIEGFDQAQGVLLTAPLNVDGGAIPAGTVVDSHMIFLNTTGVVFASDTSTFTFDKPILGVMSDRLGTLEAASNALLGALGTTYPGSFGARGMEPNGGNSGGPNADGYLVSGNTIIVRMHVTEPGDWIHVVTGCESKSKQLDDSGVEGKGIDSAPGLHKCFNPKSQAGARAGKK